MTNKSDVLKTFQGIMSALPFKFAYGMPSQYLMQQICGSGLATWLEGEILLLVNLLIRCGAGQVEKVNWYQIILGQQVNFVR